MEAPASDRPRIRVAALILREGRVVLARHRAGDRTYHLLPGGGVDWGESLEQALIREVAEETGLQCSVGRPIILSDTIAPDNTRHVVNIVFRCEAISGVITQNPADTRVETVDLVAPEQLASLDMRPPIAEPIRAFIDDPNIPTVYLGMLYRPESEHDLT